MNVLYEVKDNVALITINRPDALNALNADVLRELDAILTQAASDEEVYVLVITGGGRAFIAGADVAHMAPLDPVEAQAFGKYGVGVVNRIEDISKPVIAAINGFALGGGCELAMACDIRIAGDKAKFGQPEVTLGIIPGFGGTQRLPRIVGLAKAKELTFTGKVIGAEEALQIGLVNQVVPNDELMGVALEMAAAIAKNAQIAVRQSKVAINAGMQCDIKTGLEIEGQSFPLCFSTEDQKDAMAAFVNKTKIEKFKNK